METITFKLDDASLFKLTQRLKELDGFSRHTLARQLVIDALNDTQHEKTQKEIILLHTEINRLRVDLTTAVAVLLVKAGKVKSPEEAKAWSKKNLL